MNNTLKEQLEVINHQLKELIGIYRAAASGHGVSENEFWIWYTLVVEDGDFTQQDLCDTWNMTKQTVHSIVSNMVKRGYVYLEVIPGTRNRKAIRLTEAGRMYGERLVLPIAEAEQRALERQPPEERERFINATANYIQMLKEEIHGIQHH